MFVLYYTGTDQAKLMQAQMGMGMAQGNVDLKAGFQQECDHLSDVKHKFYLHNVETNLVGM